MASSTNAAAEPMIIDSPSMPPPTHSGTSYASDSQELLANSNKSITLPTSSTSVSSTNAVAEPMIIDSPSMPPPTRSGTSYASDSQEILASSNKPIPLPTSSTTASPIATSATSASASASATTSGPSPAKSSVTAPINPNIPVCIVMGMAGSGKTTLMQRINSYASQKRIPSYFVNLDPATQRVPFNAHIDIRDTVDYKSVMKKYNLGPNGAIMTSLNLFATRFGTVLQLLEQSSHACKYAFIDTPGQIEAFTWSASGDIMTIMLSSTFPTVLLYVIDTPRSSNPSTFVSNMLYLCSVFYRAQLPLVVCFNKVDVQSHDFAVEWMQDFEAFMEALDESSDKSYMSSLLRSLTLALDNFYNMFESVGVSGATGIGMPQLFKAIDKAAAVFEKDYRPVLEKQKAARAANDAKFKTDNAAKASSTPASAAKAVGRKVAAGKATLTEAFNALQEIEETADDDSDDDSEEPVGPKV